MTRKTAAHRRPFRRALRRTRSLARFGRLRDSRARPEKYEAVPIGITKDGRWLVGTGAVKLLGDVLKSGDRVMLPA